MPMITKQSFLLDFLEIIIFETERLFCVTLTYQCDKLFTLSNYTLTFLPNTLIDAESNL